MKPYTPEIRLQVIKSVTTKKLTPLQALEIFEISRDTLTRWLREYKKTGKFTPSCSSGRPRKLSEEQIHELETLIKQQPDITLEELLEKTNYDVCIATIHNALRDAGFIFKKNSKSR